MCETSVGRTCTASSTSVSNCLGSVASEPEVESPWILLIYSMYSNSFSASIRADSSKVNLAYLARSSANSLRYACVVSRNAASDSLALIRSVTVGRPSLPDPRPKSLTGGGGGIGLVSANSVISGCLRALNCSIGLAEFGFADAVVRFMMSPKSRPRRLLETFSWAGSVTSPTPTANVRRVRFLVVVVLPVVILDDWRLVTSMSS